MSSLSGPRAALNAAAAGEIPPGSNTGGNSSSTPPPSPLARVDTLTFTLPIVALTDDPAATLMHDDDAIGKALLGAFLAPLGLSMGSATGRHLNGYRDSAPIEAPSVDPDTNGRQNLGFVAWGGNLNRDGLDTLCVHLTGQACESINLLDDRPDRRHGWGAWSSLYLAILEHGAKLTRLDVAYDDLTGLHGGVDAAVDAYHDGGFTITRPPSVSNAGDWINGHSRTLYVGQRTNGKLIRVYEKGHQMGHPDSPWVRYELELHSRDREIPPSAILDPAGILAGSCPYLAHVVSHAQPVPVRTIVRQRLRATIDHLCGHASQAYGRLLNVLLGIGMTPAEVVERLRVDGVPSRLYVPPSACG